MKGFPVAFISTIQFDGRNISFKAKKNKASHCEGSLLSNKSNELFLRSHTHANKKLCAMFCCFVVFVFFRNVCILFR